MRCTHFAQEVLQRLAFEEGGTHRHAGTHRHIGTHRHVDAMNHIVPLFEVKIDWSQPLPIAECDTWCKIWARGVDLNLYIE